MVFVQAFYFLKDVKFDVYPDSFYSTNQATTTVSDEYLTSWFKKPNAADSLNRIFYKSGKGLIKDQHINSRLIKFNALSNTDSEIRINVMYFPGWRAYIDGKEAVINYEENGLINLELPKGESDISLKFEETKVRLLADFISILSILFLLVIRIKQIKKIHILL